MKDYISLRISYTDESGADRRSWRKYSVVTIPDEKWNSLCMNVYDQILHDAYMKADLRYKVYVELISVTRDTGVDLYIDDVFIWRDPVTGRVSYINCCCYCVASIRLTLFFRFLFVQVQRLLPAAEPGDNVLEALTVQSLGPRAWSVSLTPASCGTGIELLQIAEANVVSGNTTSDQAVFRPVNASESCSIVVSRDQASTPPVGGTFDIFLENEKVKGKFSSIPLRKYSVFKTSELLVL